MAQEENLPQVPAEPRAERSRDREEAVAAQVALGAAVRELAVIAQVVPEQAQVEQVQVEQAQSTQG